MLNLFHLKFFYDAANSGSLTISAAKNHLTRPGVSQAIRNLEQQLGVMLITHKKKEFLLTKHGEWLFKHSEALFSQIEEIKIGIKEKSNDLFGELRIGSSRSLAGILLPRTILAIEKAYPQLTVSLKLGITKQIKEDVIDRQLDIGLALFGENEKIPSSSHVILEGDFVCLESKTKQSKNRFLVTEERFETLALKRLIQKNKESDIRFLEIQSWELISDFTRQGLGIGLVPDFMHKTESGKKLRLKQGYGAVAKYKAVAFFRKPTAAVVRFLEILQDKNY